MGQILDEEQGVYYYGARYYLPEIGRFLSGDPKSEYSNFYSYVGNQPIIAVDLNGKETLFVHGYNSSPARFSPDFKAAVLSTLNDKEGHSFGWSGINYKWAFDDAAGKLALEVLQLHELGRPINLVGHSHGGNVIFLASQIIYAINKISGSNIKIDSITTLGTPIRPNIYPNMEVVKRVNTVSNLVDQVQIYGGTDRVVPFKVDLARELGMITGEMGTAGRTLPPGKNINNIIIPNNIMFQNGFTDPESAHSGFTSNIWINYIQGHLELAK